MVARPEFAVAPAAQAESGGEIILEKSVAIDFRVRGQERRAAAQKFRKDALRVLCPTSGRLEKSGGNTTRGSAKVRMALNPALRRPSSVAARARGERAAVSTATAQLSSLPLGSTAGRRRSPTPIKPRASRPRLIVGDR